VQQVDTLPYLRRCADQCLCRRSHELWSDPRDAAGDGSRKDRATAAS
jgi:hypothetical protein